MMSGFRPIAAVFAACVLVASGSSGPWTKDPAQWTPNEAARILTDSPWAQLAAVKFDDPSQEEMELANAERAATTPPPANMGGPNGATDGKWDGGVGRMPRGGKPTLNVTLIWESAKPVQQALEKNGQSATSAELIAKDYVIAISGLVPAARKLSKTSAEDEQQALQDREHLLETVMAASRLLPRGRPPILPHDAKLDAETGTLRLYFPRSPDISLKDKEIDFVTRYGAMSVRGAFHLKEMSIQGQLEL